VVAGAVTFLLAVLFVIPTAIAGWWAFWSDKPFAAAMADQHWGWIVIGPLYGWFSFAAIVACGAFLFVIVGTTLHADAMRRMLNESTRNSVGGIQPKLKLDLRVEIADGLLQIEFMNLGGPDEFTVQAQAAFGVGGYVEPTLLRWRNSTAESRHVGTGHSHYLEVLKIGHNKAAEYPPEGRFSIGDVSLLTPSGDVRMPVRFADGDKVIAPFSVGLVIGSAKSGLLERHRLHVFAACFNAPPTIQAILVAD